MADTPPELPFAKDILAASGLRAEKKFGQNFLLDSNVTDKIARNANLSEGTHVFEIGPGPGGLTRSLLLSPCEDVTAIEFDPRAIEALNPLIKAAAGKLKLIAADALEVDLCSLSSAPRAIVANLPYNVATPLLIKWLGQIANQREEAFTSMTLMFQKEVADRITADKGSKAYGRLSILVQWLCNVRQIYTLPASAFTPPPKVKSAVVHFTPKPISPNEPKFTTIEKLTAAAFGQRRKMIRSSLKAYADAIEACGLNPEKRAEDLSVEDFITLARKIDGL